MDNKVTNSVKNVHILIVEDEKAINDLIKVNLIKYGYKCTCAFDGMAAADILEEQDFDLIILDIMLPKLDGYELMEYIRPLEIPVIFLTAKAQVEERVKGLQLGAEDYMIKPFAVIELLARIEVILRRQNKVDSILHYQEYELDLNNRIVTKAGAEIELAPKEFDLFVLFVRNVNQTLQRAQIYMHVWEKEYTGDTRTLDRHVSQLRKKLELEERLKAVFKMGYRLEL